MLKSDIIWPPSCRYKSQSDWEPVGFFSECLCNSTTFDLMLGFFSSSAINVLSDGFAAFLHAGGKMRLIINDLLTREDKDAIATGGSDSLLPVFDLNNLAQIKETLSARDTHFFECLAWLIRNGRIEIKIIAPKSGNGIAHTKCGVFYDGMNKVAFDGSVNFSRTALIDNRESLTAMCDWNGRTEVAKIEDIQHDFERTFTGNDATVRYIDAAEVRTQITNAFPDKELKDLLEDEEKLLGDHIPQAISPTVELALQNARNKVRKKIEKYATIETGKNDEPRFPYPTGPRPYQVEAFENWKANKQKGLFAMATGTGKTITALNCLLEIYKSPKGGYYKALILVPTITLVEQWEQECRKFNFKNIVKVCSKFPNWRTEIDNITLREEFNPSGKEANYIIISTYASFARDKVFNILNAFPRRKLLLIADEAHNMGSGRILSRLSGINYLRRIGLSATPERQYDDAGNARLLDFFGSNDSYTFEYTMKQAIEGDVDGKPVLCRYKYYPHLVHLTEEEMSAYMEISLKLAKVYNYSKNSFPDGDDIVKTLLLARKRIIHKAVNKIELFRQIISDRLKEKGNLKYTLVYVPEGCRPDDRNADIYDQHDYIGDDETSSHLIDIYTDIVRQASPTTTVKQFISGSGERDKMLADFADGSLEVLTSMKCLDEGVDVPRSELAIFCASTGNPRQFIQRRGRILRMHPDKHMAIIHDMVVAPEVNPGSDNFEMEKRLLEGELRRVRNFASLSENIDFAASELDGILEYYNLSIF